MYEDYPEDQDPIEGQDVGQHPPLALKIAKEVREVGNRLFKEGKYDAALYKYQSASRPVLSPAHPAAPRRARQL